jgi:oligopeptide/dipeptide ABC transporter ATP-binding protein
MIELRDLSKHYRVGRGWSRAAAVLRAVDRVSFAIGPGESVGLVGESGSGKSTIGQLVLGLIEPTSGGIFFDGHRLPAGRSALRVLRGQSQVVFQDPYDALSPRQRVREIVLEPLRNLGRHSRPELEDLAVRALERVGLHAQDLDKYPHQFSGGQRQRIGIARAMSVSPRFIVLDEPVSALDVSIQAQVVNLLMDIRREQGIAFLFISHNLAVIEHSCERIVVLYLGKVMEIVPTEQLHVLPLHPYTRALVDAIPVPDPSLRQPTRTLAGEIPDAANPPTGCRFSSRCQLALDDCRTVEPALVEHQPGHWSACHRHAELSRPAVQA